MELKQADSGSESKSTPSVQGDLEYNDLSYTSPANLTLRVHRTQRQMKADRTSYSANETCTIRLNTGSDYLDVKNGYLTFSVAVNAGTGDFGINSALALINQVVVRSKSGVEVDRFRRINLYKAHQLKHDKSVDWRVKQGTLLGYTPDAESTANPSAGAVTTTPVKYVIPLCHICGVFDPVGPSQLMPAALASGLEVEITFEAFDRALKEATAGITTYTITNPEIHVESIRLTDSAQRVLNMKAAKEGLSYMYYRYHTSEIPANATTLTHRVALAVGQCVEAAALIVNGTAALTTDNFATIAHDATAWYYRIGQLYYPATTLQDDAAGRESYFQALKTYNKLKEGGDVSAVSQTDYVGVFGGLLMPFNKDDNMLMSGEAINNSRQLELQVTRSASNATDQQVLFVKYLAQARVFLDSVVVAV